ncbi:MAG: hypothetical protein GY711_28665 [bacterium]|nr:hypothetical protein [bacterium]
MTRNTVSSSLLTLLATAVPAAAQNPIDTIYVDDSYTIDIGPYGTGAYRSGFTCEANGDATPDAVIMIGARPKLVFGPADYRCLVTFPWDAVDVARLDDPNSAIDSFVTLSSSGLRHHSYQSGSVPFVSQLLGTGTWTSANQLVTGDFDASGTPDVMAVNAAQDGLLVMLNALSPTPLESSISLGATILDVAPVNWLSSGTQCAVLSTSGLEVVGYDGTIHFTSAFTATSGYVIPFEQGGYSAQRLAVGYKTSAVSNDFLLVCDDTVSETVIDLGDEGYYGGSTADLDNDATGDLALVKTSAKKIILFDNLSDGSPPGSAPTFSTSDITVVTYGTGDAQTAIATPILADFDNDRDIEFLMPRDASDDLLISRNQFYDAANYRTGVTALSFTHVVDPYPNSQVLAFTLQEPDNFDPAYNKIEVLSYLRQDLNSPQDRTVVKKIEINSSSNFDSYNFRITLDDTAEMSAEYLRCMIRVIQTDGSGNILAGQPRVQAILGKGGAHWHYETLGYPTQPIPTTYFPERPRDTPPGGDPGNGLSCDDGPGDDPGDDDSGFGTD